MVSQVSRFLGVFKSFNDVEKFFTNCGEQKKDGDEVVIGNGAYVVVAGAWVKLAPFVRESKNFANKVKFRGESINGGKFAYGYLTKGIYLAQPNYYISTEDHKHIPVETESVTQFIGYCEKQGKELYYGDEVFVTVAPLQTKRCRIDLSLGSTVFVTVDQTREIMPIGKFILADSGGRFDTLDCVLAK